MLMRSDIGHQITKISLYNAELLIPFDINMIETKRLILSIYELNNVHKALLDLSRTKNRQRICFLCKWSVESSFRWLQNMTRKDLIRKKKKILRLNKTSLDNFSVPYSETMWSYYVVYRCFLNQPILSIELYSDVSHINISWL